MKNISHQMNTYRECVRNLWNTYFLSNVSTRNGWDISDEFDDMSTLLFSSLVLLPNKCTIYKKSHCYDKLQQPLLGIKVIPTSEEGIPIQINREVNKSGYWDYPLTFIQPAEADLRFIDFFNFDQLAYRDFRFCQIRIIGSDVYPELIGRDALVDCSDVKFYFDEQQ